MQEGEKLTLLAILQEGYRFVQWADTLTDNPCILDGVSSSLDLAPTSAVRTYAVAFALNGLAKDIPA